MFNNRFNSSKNDPLVEAVKAARADGDTRRLAESMTNGLFGVFSRQAVVREHLSDYDFALEEAYKCMKEEDKMADKDYDRDGKIETSKKEVWGSRLRAAKASGKYKGPVDEDSSNGLPPSDAAKQAGAAQQAQTPSSTPKRTGNAAGSTISNARDAAGMNEAQLDELKKPTAKTAMDAYHRAYDSDVRSGGEGKRTARLGRWKQKNLSDKSARNQKDTGKAAGMNEEEQIDEISTKLARSYLSKATDSSSNKRRTPGVFRARGKMTGEPYEKIDRGVTVGHQYPKVLTKEEQIDEISKELAGRYIKKADYKRSDSSFQSGKVYGKELATKRRTKQDVEDARKHNRDSFKREKGINTAVNKLTGKAKVAANEEVMKESIKAKLFAKHMKEDSSFKSAQVTGKSVNEVVSVAQLSAFRNKVGNQNATLGQYMNAQKGLTARKGGANDPSVIQNKLKAGQTAYNPSSSGTPATTTMKTSRAYNQSDIAASVAKGAYGSTQSIATSLATSKPAQASGSDITDKATYDTKTTKPAPFQPGPSSVKLSPEPQKFSGSAEGPAPVAKPAAPAPAPEQKRKEAGSMPAAPVAECVQVGVNKYRIV
jgi:hypothetical protein